MKYNWPAIVDMLNTLMIDNTKILGATPAATIDLMQYYKLTMRATDTFHPFESEHTLSTALANMPNYCNYRNYRALASYKDRKEALLNALFDVLAEMEEITQNWFDDNWNHAPGYVKPLDIEFSSWYKVVDKSFAKLIKAAKKPR